MSLSQLPTELLLDIVSYLPTPIKENSWYDCETGPNPESNFQDLSALFALSLVNRRLSTIVTPILHDLAVEETRRCFKVINGDYRKDCIGHYPGALALAIRTGNLRLTQELFKHIPPDEFPPDDGVSYFVEGMSHWERRFVSDSNPGFIIERVRHTESNPPQMCLMPSRDALLYIVFRSGHVNVARWLLDNLNLMGGPVLHPFSAPQHAIISGNVEMLELVRERCDPRWRDKCLLRGAVRQNNVAIVRWILEQGIIGDVRTMMRVAGVWYSMEHITIFEWACKFCDLEIVKLLVKHDSERHDPEERVHRYEYGNIDRTFQRWSQWMKELQQPEDFKATKNEPMLLIWDCYRMPGMKRPGKRDVRENTQWDPYDPVTDLVARNADLELIKTVLERAPEKVRRRNIQNMLHVAVRHSHLELTKHLIYDLKINVNTHNERGELPLMCSQNTEMLKLLLDSGADLFGPPKNLERRLPIEKLFYDPGLLKVALQFVPDLPSPNGPLNTLFRNAKNAQIERWFNAAGTIFLDAGVSMEGLEEHVKRYKDKLKAQQGQTEGTDVPDEGLDGF